MSMKPSKISHDLGFEETWKHCLWIKEGRSENPPWVYQRDGHWEPGQSGFAGMMRAELKGVFPTDKETGRAVGTVDGTCKSVYSACNLEMYWLGSSGWKVIWLLEGGSKRGKKNWKIDTEKYKKQKKEKRDSTEWLWSRGLLAEKVHRADVLSNQFPVVHFQLPVPFWWLITGSSGNTCLRYVLLIHFLPAYASDSSHKLFLIGQCNSKI